uniref:uncharacterized protein LOC120339116 isoform X1 n=2 Tax=Styela clava TaxID=7725 RepID=UPI001939661C|nr:uncharacterized protein LOC120339116 isoform X1 [Styela clava]
MSTVKYLCCFAIVALHIELSYGHCNIMAECENELQWKRWTNSYEPGKPGKRGAPGPHGPPGAKGEPGETIEVIPAPDKDETTPVMHFLGHTVTWNTAKTFCHVTGKKLCRTNELCPSNRGGRQMIHDAIPGDHWVPVLDGSNKWMQAGDSRRFTCHTHTETHGGGMASWGTSNSPAPHKGYVYCCGEKYTGPRYQYIGKAATYDMSKQHCVNQGRRLCHAGEICTNNKPIYGIIARDAWVAANDRHNEWIQIGNSNTCAVHGVLHSAPAWGIRTDGRLFDFLGFVLCCQN